MCNQLSSSWGGGEKNLKNVAHHEKMADLFPYFLQVKVLVTDVKTSTKIAKL